MNFNIPDILHRGEGISVEFKTSFNDEVIETLCAFANTEGGMVYVGVNDDRKVAGVTLAQESVQKWINEIKNKTQNQIVPNVEVLEIEHKNVVVFCISENPVKPIAYKGRFYKRIKNSNHLLSVDEISNEHLRTVNSSWDFYIDPNHTLKDLSKQKIAKFANKIREKEFFNQINLTDTEILNKLELFRDGKITFASYLLFVNEYCPISDMQIGRFKSPTMIIDSISLNTDLISEVENTIAFIKKHLQVEYIITGEPQRTERFDYPPDAIREIVINMIVHRDYRDSSASIIKIYDNRIEFFNPGKLYGGLTVEDLLSGNYISKSRNKLIAKAFKEMGTIERYGSGIMRVRQICRDYGVIEPDFNEVFNGFQVILYSERTDKNENIENLPETVENVTEKGTENVTENVTEKGTEKGTENVTGKGTEKGTEKGTGKGTEKRTEKGTEKGTEKRTEKGTEKGTEERTEKGTEKLSVNQQKIIENMKVNSIISIKELSEIVGIAESKIKANIAKLKSRGILERVGANKGGYWKIAQNQKLTEQTQNKI
ncbi:MAG: putative DNA binding domain-containing protein [Prevotellaceae bacterium]|jgi:ATP-dependent DNA helicase RecG|nr:putative DNA binding domain-containing protein [Prevotellaceae bacterium]